MSNIDYDEYIQSDEWKVIRTKRLRFAKYRCELCNIESKQLHVHHRTYERLGKERVSDLICLCLKCHEKHHNIVNENKSNSEHCELCKYGYFYEDSSMGHCRKHAPKIYVSRYDDFTMTVWAQVKRHDLCGDFEKE